MLRCINQFYVVLRYSTQSCAVLCCATECCAALRSSALHCAALTSGRRQHAASPLPGRRQRQAAARPPVLFCIPWRHAVLHNSVLYCIVPDSAAQNCTIFRRHSGRTVLGMILWSSAIFQVLDERASAPQSARVIPKAAFIWQTLF